MWHVTCGRLDNCENDSTTLLDPDNPLAVSGGWRGGLQHGDGYQVACSPSRSVSSLQTFPNGNIMDGSWQDGGRHGVFIFTFPNGERWRYQCCGGPLSPGTRRPTLPGPDKARGARSSPCLPTLSSCTGPGTDGTYLNKLAVFETDNIQA